MKALSLQSFHLNGIPSHEIKHFIFFFAFLKKDSLQVLAPDSHRDSKYKYEVNWII